MRNRHLLFILILIFFSCQKVDSESMKLALQSEKPKYENNWNKIFELNDEAIQIDNKNYRAYNNRAWARFNLKHDSTLIINDINKAIDLNPDYVTAIRNKIIYYYEFQNVKKVVELGTVFLREHEDQEICRLVGEGYNRLENWQLAKGYLSRALKLNSQDFAAFKERGVANRFLGYLDQSLDDLNNAVLLNPNFSQSYNSRALTWEEFSEFEKAIDDYTRAIYTDSSKGVYWYNRATLYFKLEEVDKGCYDIKKASELRNPLAEELRLKNCN